MQHYICDFTYIIRTSLVAQMVNRLPTRRENRVLYLGQEDPLEKEMATHSSTPVWRILWTEKPGGLQSMGSQRGGHDFTFTYIITTLWGLQASCRIWDLGGGSAECSSSGPKIPACKINLKCFYLSLNPVTKSHCYSYGWIERILIP